jgi:transposase
LLNPYTGLKRKSISFLLFFFSSLLLCDFARNNCLNQFREIAVEYQKRIQVDSLIVADSALYTESNIKLMSSIKWLTRVPLTIKLAKSLVMSLAESEFVKSEKSGYSYAQRKITYGDIGQRWLVV